MTGYDYIRKTFFYDGKRYEVSGKTDEEAIKKKLLKLQQLERGHVIINSAMPVSAWFNEAVTTYKTGLSEQWLRSFTDLTNKHVLATIGYMKLKDVRPLHCQKILNNVSDKSQSLIDKVYQCIDFIFRTAQENDLIATNPATKLVKPTGYTSSRRSITDFERRITLQVAERHRAGSWVLCMLYCGLRPSETALLQGKDIVLIDGVRCLFVNGTKSNAAKRYVPLPDYLYARLPRVSPFDYIFATKSNKQLTKTNMRRLWHSFKREMNLEAGCKTYRNELIAPYPIDTSLTPYFFRHTYCTDLQNAGVDIRVAQKLMGHSRIDITAKIYSHNDTFAINKASELITAHIELKNNSEEEVAQ